MSTAPKQTSAQVGPAINGITSMSDSLSMAQNLKAAVESIASNEGFRTFSHLIDQIPQLEKDIETKENQLKELYSQLRSERDNHSTQEQNALSAYDKKYDMFKKENATLQDKIAQLQTDVKGKEGKNTELQTALERVETIGRKLKAEYDTKTSRLKEREQEITDLKNQAQGFQATAIESSKKLSEARNRVAKLEESLDKSIRQHEVLKKDFNETEGRLEELLNFSVPLRDRDLQTV
jgi:chromosome segregation ATPase